MSGPATKLKKTPISLDELAKHTDRPFCDFHNAVGAILYQTEHQTAWIEIHDDGYFCSVNDLACKHADLQTVEEFMKIRCFPEVIWAEALVELETISSWRNATPAARKAFGELFIDGRFSGPAVREIAMGWLYFNAGWLMCDIETERNTQQVYEILQREGKLNDHAVIS
jgi:hypothetical protein